MLDIFWIVAVVVPEGDGTRYIPLASPVLLAVILAVFSPLTRVLQNSLPFVSTYMPYELSTALTVIGLPVKEICELSKFDFRYIPYELLNREPIGATENVVPEIIASESVMASALIP
jgi:hypothetical protein